MFNAKALAKKYPYCDIPTLVKMLEGRMFIDEFTATRKDEIDILFGKYLSDIEAIFSSYMKGRLDFNDEDLPHMNKLISKCKKLLKVLYKDFLEYYIVTCKDVYTYQTKYTLWVLDGFVNDEQFHEKPVLVGEQKETLLNEVNLTKEKLSELVYRPIYDKTITERLNMSQEIANKNLSTIVTSNIEQHKSLNELFKSLNKNLTKDVRNKMKSAISMGIEEMETIGEGDVFQINRIYVGGYQRCEYLDNRTCLVCASLDGAIYQKPMGKIHKNCRGCDIPVKLDENKQPILANPTLNNKKAMNKNFDNWFNSLSEAEKQTTLGKTKYNMYKAGKLKPKDIIKGARVETLAEQKQKELITKVTAEANDYETSIKLINYTRDKLPQKDITSITSKEDVLAYEKYINIKESIYKNIPSADLKEQKIHRNTLNAEIRNERKLLATKKKQIILTEKMANIK